MCAREEAVRGEETTFWGEFKFRITVDFVGVSETVVVQKGSVPPPNAFTFWANILLFQKKKKQKNYQMFDTSTGGLPLKASKSPVIDTGSLLT
jgi:hypothetical protein